MPNGADLYARDFRAVDFVLVRGRPCTDGGVVSARAGRDVWVLGDGKRPDLEPLRFTAAELAAAGIDVARLGPDS
ncbi:DUF397 domain-containing protein [Streptomyces seoulensis]